MNAIDRIQEQYDASNKSSKGKIMSGTKGKIISGAKERATKRYFKEAASRERRKQGKTRFDTHRREYQPDEKDIWLENIHFANFLGAKDVCGVPYNITHFDEHDNIIERDIYLNSQDKDDSEYNYGYGSWAPQISREPNTNRHINWDFDPEKPNQRGLCIIKREREDDADERSAKLMRSEFDTLSRMEEGLLDNEMQQEENNFAAMVAYMKQQMALAQQMITDEMVAYMKQQVALAQKMMEDELKPCDCFSYYTKFNATD